jgi:hypothetical protein
MTKRLLHRAGWALAGTLVILLTRTVAYAVSPSPTAELLEHRVGGPALPVLALVALSAGAAVAIAVTFLAWLGVRERALLENRAAPRLRLERTLASALVVFATTAPLGGLLEAYIHWRAGLGWHGLHCVFGPIHRNLLPIDGSFSLVAAAFAAAAEHVLSWVQRTFERLAAGAPFLLFPSPALPARPRRRPPLRPLVAASARAPPALS